MAGPFADRTSCALVAALNAAAVRQRVVAHNIANADTPGYRRFRVEFEHELKRALASRARPAQMERIGPMVVPDSSPPMRADGNNVDIDREMVGLAQNSLAYNAIAQALLARGQMLRLAITEGRR